MGVIQQVSAVPDNKGAAPPSGARVLIVDDDERNAFAAVQALEELGHELVIAHSGKDALRELLAGDFAVILLDLHMPEMDGYETARFIRGHPRTKHIPIVFVTAVFRDEAHLFQAYTVGAVDVVFKPVDPFILRSKVSVLVELHLKTAEVTRQAARLQTLVDENARVHAEKLAAERALAQAQKMEAVGQLTGGVAHDFNNLLTIVMGNADMMIRRSQDDSPLLPKLQAIRQAAVRGQALNRQLLAFARRDRLRSAVTDVDGLINDFLPLMAQAVGEAVAIQAIGADAELRIDVDPAHLETALLNLAVNARDAMAEGGRLTIRTRRGAGDFAVIEVEDTGCGMPDEVAKHVFEPFFTTKEVGKGSGLGLAQVYGFLQQSGGEVRVRSKVGQGTVFELYLPLTDRPIQPASAADVAAASVLVGGSEEVLVVEDDEQVRALTVDMLQGLGYSVIVAPNAKAALSLLKGQRQFDALMTDVVMPGGMSGIQLAKTARKLRPDLPILLTSGYAGGQGAADGEFAFLSKPYELGVLASRLREVIGTAEPEASRA